MLEPESKVIHATENQNEPNLKFQKNLKLRLVKRFFSYQMNTNQFQIDEHFDVNINVSLLPSRLFLKIGC
jgi:hypothetical protein